MQTLASGLGGQTNPGGSVRMIPSSLDCSFSVRLSVVLVVLTPAGVARKVSTDTTDPLPALSLCFSVMYSAGHLRNGRLVEVTESRCEPLSKSYAQ